ncbi:MAG: hypothetical protein DCE92_08740 [Alphaproteobacteria bacterium]|nr:MAG: hypothetical protein DCE92_08740 [Alphaproteobacteria bacterium]
MAKSTGVPVGTVNLFFRNLREARLVTTGARGVNAPAMQRLDAARLLLAIAVTDRPVRAAQAVRDFGQLTDIDQDTISAEVGIANALAKLANEPGSWRIVCHVHVQTLAVELMCVDSPKFTRSMAEGGEQERPWTSQHFLHPNYAIPPSDSDDFEEIAAELDRDDAVEEIKARYFNRLQVTRTLLPVVLDEIAALFPSDAADEPESDRQP